MARKRGSRVDPIVKTDGDTTTIDTGIYRRTIRQVESKSAGVVSVGQGEHSATFQAAFAKSAAEMQADVERWNAEPWRTLQLVRQQAIRFYSEYAVEVGDMANPPLRTTMHRFDLGDGLKTYQLPDDAPPIARDAAEVLNELYAVEVCRHGFQLSAAFKLGRLYERMLVRQLEPRALSGLRKAHRNRQNNVSRAAAAASKNAERLKAFDEAIEQQQRSRQSRSIKRALTTAATKCGCSIETVKKARRCRT